MEGRELGYWETALTLLHDQLFGTGTIFTATLVKGHIDAQLLHQACYLLFQKHPLLRATIHNYFFSLNAAFSDIPFQVISKKSTNDWQQVVEQALNLLFPSDKYLWRVFFLSGNKNDNQNEIIFLLHHAIADGLSCVNLAKELLIFYHQLLNAKLQTPGSLPLRDPVEILLDRNQFLSVERKKKMTFPLEKFAYQGYQPLGKRTTKNIYRVLPTLFLQKITEISYQNKIKINAIFNAAMLLTIGRIASPSDAINLITPISLRKFCPITIRSDEVGCYITCLDTQFDELSGESNFWQTAHDYEKKLMDQFSKLHTLPKQFDFTNRENFSTLLAIENAATRRFFPSGFCVTNKGQIDFPHQLSGLNIVGYFTSSSRQAGDIVINLSITSLLQQTFLCFTYCYPLIEKNWANQFADTYLQILSELH